MIDFEYDGQYLSDYGYIVCNFNDQKGFAFVDAGSKIKFNKVSRYSGKNFSLTSTEYSECITTEIDICKNPDIFDNDEMEISSDEYRDMIRWLNRREFCKLKIIDDRSGEDVFFNASFNVEKVILGGNLYGLRLKMETDKPFGYGDKRTIMLDFENTEENKQIRVYSDDFTSFCPNLVITCNDNGSLCISNDKENCTMVIKNCTVGEVITIDGYNQIIKSSLDSHNLSADFNFEFLKVSNSIDDKVNNISSSLRCSIILDYLPVIKYAP